MQALSWEADVARGGEALAGILPPLQRQAGSYDRG
jgi:hypothetical protein